MAFDSIASVKENKKKKKGNGERESDTLMEDEMHACEQYKYSATVQEHKYPWRCCIYLFRFPSSSVLHLTNIIFVCSHNFLAFAFSLSECSLRSFVCISGDSKLSREYGVRTRTHGVSVSRIAKNV